jgi:hypothetical protein
MSITRKITATIAAAVVISGVGFGATAATAVSASTAQSTSISAEIPVTVDPVAIGDATYDGVVYGVWIFEQGTFVNNGDGGYINWAAYGLINRVSDSTMVFSPFS